jgi:hypothetical protein
LQKLQVPSFFYSSLVHVTAHERKNMTQQVAPEGTTAPPATQSEHMVPISRLNEVIADRKKLEDKVATMEAAEKAETEKRLAEQNQWKEVAEKRGEELVKAQAEAAKVGGMEATLAQVLAAQVEALPKDKRALVPDALTTQGKLDWLAKNAAILKAPAAFDIGAGHLGGGEDNTPPVLSPEEEQVAAAFGMKKEDYAKNR